jgi:hypothetical protein
MPERLLNGLRFDPSGSVQMYWSFARNWCWVCGNDNFENYAGIIYIS